MCLYKSCLLKWNSFLLLLLWLCFHNSSNTHLMQHYTTALNTLHSTLWTRLRGHTNNSSRPVTLTLTCITAASHWDEMWRPNHVTDFRVWPWLMATIGNVIVSGDRLLMTSQWCCCCCWKTFSPRDTPRDSSRDTWRRVSHWLDGGNNNSLQATMNTSSL